MHTPLVYKQDASYNRRKGDREETQTFVHLSSSKIKSMNPYILNYLKLSLCNYKEDTECTAYPICTHREREKRDRGGEEKERREIEGEKRKEGRRKREREQ